MSGAWTRALPRGMRWVGPGATLVLVLLCVVLAAGVSVAVWWDQRPGSSRPSQAQPVTSLEARDAVLDGAGPVVERVLSYDWEGFDDVVAETREELLSARFAAEYTDLMEGLRTAVERDRVTVRATATEVAVVSAGPDRAVALVYLDQVSTTEGSPGSRTDEVRVLVTMRADAGEWRVSRMDAF